MAHRKQKSAARVEGFQWDFSKLANPETYYAEAKRGYDLGIPSCGRFGVSCPKCYLPIGADGKGGKKDGISWCECEGRDGDPKVVAEVLGFTQYGYGGTRKALVI